MASFAITQMAPSGLNSGVINYINKFSDPGYKSLDPVSELFYESIRYFKNLGPTPEYSAGLTTDRHGRLSYSKLGKIPSSTVARRTSSLQSTTRILGSTRSCQARISLRRRSAGAGGTVTLDGGDFGEPEQPRPDINVTDTDE